jgi:hypothetical protein
MKEAPHKAGPEARNNYRHQLSSIGLASPQLTLVEPITRRPPALEIVHAAFREGSGHA